MANTYDFKHTSWNPKEGFWADGVNYGYDPRQGFSPATLNATDLAGYNKYAQSDAWKNLSGKIKRDGGTAPTLSPVNPVLADLMAGANYLTMPKGVTRNWTDPNLSLNSLNLSKLLPQQVPQTTLPATPTAPHQSDTNQTMGMFQSLLQHFGGSMPGLQSKATVGAGSASPPPRQQTSGMMSFPQQTGGFQSFQPWQPLPNTFRPPQIQQWMGGSYPQQQQYQPQYPQQQSYYQQSPMTAASGWY